MPCPSFLVFRFVCLFLSYANYYTKEVMLIVIREFASPDDEMKKIVLKVVKQCVGCSGVEPAYVRSTILPDFFKHFWVRRMALDKRNYKQLVETTVHILFLFVEL